MRNRRFAVAGLVLIMLLVLGGAVVRIVHQSLVFQPQQFQTPPDRYARLVGANVVRFKAGDGTVLSGLFFPARSNQSPLIIFLYGNADTCANETQRLQWLSRSLGYSSVCFDYRGYGFSEGTPDAARIRTDVLSLYDFVVSRLDAKHRAPYVYGWSLGTQFAVHIAANRPVCGLILQAPAASATEEVAYQGTQMLGKWASIVRPVPDDNVAQLFQGRAEIASVRAPLLVIHGTADKVVPLEQGREVFQAAASRRKRFVAVPGAHHNDLEYFASPAGPAIAQFLDTAIGT